MKDQVSRYGVWKVENAWSPTLAKQLESQGYGTLWIGGSKDSELLVAEELLEATSTVVVATGIINVWSTDPDVVGQAFHRLERRFPGRFLLGVGAGHRESNQTLYDKPYTAVKHYLDRLDAAAVPKHRRVLAALGNDMVRLSGRRSLGAHPYLTTPAHTRSARGLLGLPPLLAPEQKVVLGSDSQYTRAVARSAVEDPYLKRLNYRKNLVTLGYAERELDGGGSDRLIDDLVLQGTAVEVAERLDDHHSAGADHVAIQLLAGAEQPSVESYRDLAHALGIFTAAG
ncbi:MAG: TIGR03620 family F420-dependent LLM class oxidoreductase [Comamonadaceae bacterium]|jgi:probable F420-dependent oxidoreductase|nr:MAG: TIGR03620 family F420-dependent LLM class oxidoreductase [Comamonadaceae bacterium]